MFARRRDVLQREADRIGALAVRGDVSIPQDLERAVATTLEAFGGLDIVVWNSGGPPPGRGPTVTPESLEQAFELMLHAGRPPRPARLPHLRGERGRAHRRDHLARREGADRAARALEHAPPRAHRLAEDARPRARPEAASPSTASHPAGSPPPGSTSSIPDGPTEATWRRSRSAAGASRASSATSSASSPPTARDTSPARRSSSTAGCSGRSSSEGRRSPPRLGGVLVGLVVARCDRPLPRSVERLSCCCPTRRTRSRRS